jgi:hypothetical protein
MKLNFLPMIAVIEEEGLAPLRIVFTIATIVFLFAGFFIWRRRHEYFDADPDVDNDVPVVRHNREEVILSVWAGLTVVVVYIMFQVWSA